MNYRNPDDPGGFIEAEWGKPGLCDNLIESLERLDSVDGYPPPEMLQESRSPAMRRLYRIRLLGPASPASLRQHRNRMAARDKFDPDEPPLPGYREMPASVRYEDYPMPPRTKAGKKAKIHTVMKEFQSRSLHSGSPTGPKVTKRKQAVAIALSEAGLGKRKK